MARKMDYCPTADLRYIYAKVVPVIGHLIRINACVLLVIVFAACQPQQPEEALLPTLMVLPSLTPSWTPELRSLPQPTATIENRPTLPPTFTPTITNTAQPSATITDTPRPVPTATKLSSSTPVPTARTQPTRRPTIAPTATTPCDALSWETDALGVLSVIGTVQGDQQAYNTIVNLPYPSCVTDARFNLLNYIAEYTQYDQASNENNYDAALVHIQNASTYFEAFSSAIDLLVGTYSGGGGTLCNDGTFSSSSGRGTCSHHGGVSH